MDRNELEDRIRASLQARAGDVEPTPTLWQRVSERVTRRSWWQVGAWTLSGAAAVVALLVGVAALLDTPPRSVQIDPVQSETATEADPTPTPTETGTPTTEPTETGSPTPVDPDGADGAGPPVVVADDQGVHEVDPTTGEVVAELPVFEGLAEGGPVADVAVRPGSGPDELVVASVIAFEGSDWEIEISTFGPDRTRTDRIRVPAFDEQGEEISAGGTFDPDLPLAHPTVVWSEDGDHLAWGRQEGDNVVHVMVTSYADLQVERDQVVPTEIARMPEDGVPESPAKVEDWTGDPTSRSVLHLSTAGVGGIRQLDVCLPEGLCSEDARREMPFEGDQVLDIAHLPNGSTLVLVIRTQGPERDAGNATLELVANPMDDTQRTLEVPEGTFPEWTASPIDGWLEAGGQGRVAVGFGPTGQLLTISGELAEDLQVSDAVELPENLTAVGVGGRG